MLIERYKLGEAAMHTINAYDTDLFLARMQERIAQLHRLDHSTEEGREEAMDQCRNLMATVAMYQRRLERLDEGSANYVAMAAAA